MLRVGILDDGARAALRRELDAILPGRADQRAEFLDRADEALAEYRREMLPLAEGLLERDGSLDEMAGAAAALVRFGRAAKNLRKPKDDLTIDTLDAALLPAGVTFDQAGEALRVLQAIAKAAADTRKRDQQRLKGRRGGAEAMAVGRLVVTLGADYARVFSDRPSAAPGYFTRALVVIFDAGGLGAPPQKTRLAELLNGESIGGEAPKRGRKARVE